MGRKGLLLCGLAGLGLIGAGGLVLAQDQPSNTAAPAVPPTVQPAPAPPAPPSPPPVVEMPPSEPAPPPPPPANVADDDEDKAPAANTITPKPVAEAPPPPKRPRYTTAVLQALDKVTAETLRFEAKVNEPVRYKDLVITVHACETTATDETFPEAAAHLDVQYQPDVLPGAKGPVARRVYQGWMFAQSPALHPLQHPIYDVWVIACRTPSPAAAAPGAPGASL
jgi:hypothetical protein